MSLKRTSSDGSVSWVPAFELLLCLVAIFAILVLTETPTKQTSSIETLGVYAVTMTWSTGSNDDIDLYVRDPDGNVCYFGAEDVGLMHLETDDLGTKNSGTYGEVTVRAHTERTIIRGVVPGEYIVNAQEFQKSDPGPMKVTITLWRLRGGDLKVISKTVTLNKNGDIAFAFRFTLDAQKNVSGTSMLPKDIVTPAVSGTG